MTLQLTEPVAAALVARLVAGLNAQIDIVNAQSGDEVALHHIDDARILDHLPTLEMMTSFPVIGVGEGNASFEDDTGHSMTGRYQFAVCVYESDVDRQVLATKLRRLRLAVARCAVGARGPLYDAAGENIAAYGVRPIRLMPGDVIGDYNQHERRVTSFMAWCGLVIECLADENA